MTIRKVIPLIEPALAAALGSFRPPALARFRHGRGFQHIMPYRRRLRIRPADARATARGHPRRATYPGDRPCRRPMRRRRRRRPGRPQRPANANRRRAQAHRLHVGLPGGGLRAALMRATSDELAACVIVGMMSTYEGLLSDCVAPHTWMLFPAGWSKVAIGRPRGERRAFASPRPVSSRRRVVHRRTACATRIYALRRPTPRPCAAEAYYGRVLSRTASLRRSNAGGGACLAPSRLCAGL